MMKTTYDHRILSIGQHHTAAGGNFYLASSPDAHYQNLQQATMTVKERNSERINCGKSAYRHVPHSEKPPQVVERRNARERRRVQTVNSAFLRLRKHVPCQTKQKRLSKVKTLRVAIDYIKELQDMIVDHDHTPVNFHSRKATSDSGGQENEFPTLRNTNDHIVLSRKRNFQLDNQKNCDPEQVGGHAQENPGNVLILS